MFSVTTGTASASALRDEGPGNATDALEDDAEGVLGLPQRRDVAVPDGGDRHGREVQRGEVHGLGVLRRRAEGPVGTPRRV